MVMKAMLYSWELQEKKHEIDLLLEIVDRLFNTVQYEVEVLAILDPILLDSQPRCILMM